MFIILFILFLNLLGVVCIGVAINTMLKRKEATRLAQHYGYYDYKDAAYHLGLSRNRPVERVWPREVIDAIRSHHGPPAPRRQVIST